MRDHAHTLPPLNMRPLTLGSYATLQALASAYLREDATPTAIDAAVWWHVHTAPLTDAMALSQVAPAHAEIIAVAAACELPAYEIETIDAYARRSVQCLAASRAEIRGESSAGDSKN